LIRDILPRSPLLRRYRDMTAFSHLTRRWFLSASAGLAGLLAGSRLGLAQDAPKSGGRLVVAADTEPKNLNPAIVASNGVFYVASKVIEPLAEMTDEGPLRPVLATSWEPATDGKSFTFKLRPGVKWHDGQPFSSADVAFSAMQVWKPLQNLGRVVFANLAAVDTPDAETAVFHFSEPTPGQLIENALPALTSVLPKHLYDGTDIASNPHNVELVGTGPFRFVEHKPGELYRLQRNPDYWEAGHPHLDEIVYRVLPDAAAKAAALETNDIQLTAFSAVPLSDLARLDAIDGIEVIRKGYDGITYQVTLEINHRRKEFQDVRVRQALKHAIDPSFIIDNIFLGYAEAAQGPVPQSAKAMFATGLPDYAYDPKQAESLLDEAGYPRDGNGVRFAVNLLPAPWFQQTRQTGDYVKQALQQIGIETTIVNNDPGAHLKAVYTDHAFDLAIGSPVYRNDPAISTTVLYQGGLPAGVPFSNQYGYDDPTMNKIIADAAVTIDPAARTELYRTFQREAMTQLPLLHLVNFTFITVARSSVRNVGNNPRWATSSWYDTWLDA
jgi:peptide/nickel transport system substrate-binding protein